MEAVNELTELDTNLSIDVYSKKDEGYLGSVKLPFVPPIGATLAFKTNRNEKLYEGKVVAIDIDIATVNPLLTIWVEGRFMGDQKDVPAAA